MSNYPNSLDNDSTIIRVDDDVTQLGGMAIDQCRSAIFAIEAQVGIGGAGAVGSIAARIGVSIDPNGNLLPSAILTAISSTQFTNAQISTTAAISESKIALTYSTQSLYNNIQTVATLTNAVNQFAQTTESDFLKHLSGVSPLSGGESGRHVVSQIDINTAPTDSRDPTFTWPGGQAPTNASGQLRGSNLALFLYNLNEDLVNHELANGNINPNNVPDQYAHVAAGISVNSSAFELIPKTVVNVQEFANFVDQTSFAGLSTHQQSEHANNIPRTCHGTLLSSTDDGYVGSSQEIIPFTLCKTFNNDNGSGGSAGGPVDSTVYGDDVIEFTPTPDSTYNFDSNFSKVKPGQIVTVNYGTVQSQFIIESARATYDGASPPNRTYYIRINGKNIMDSYSAVARIDSAIAQNNTTGILALGQTNNTFDATPSITVSDPRAANAVGIGFDPAALSPSNYNLYLQVYPTGNPADHVLALPAIDVTGNLGTTPGAYTLSTVIAATNDAFSAPGYNFRFIAYNANGEFGIAMTDAVNGAGFSIVNGTVNTAGTLAVGPYPNNVVGDAAGTADPLGFGVNGANIASPPYQSSFTTIQQALLPTQIFLPLVNKNYYVNGIGLGILNGIAPSDGYVDVNGDGYWMASIVSKNIAPGITVRATYQVNQNLSKYSLFPGKTILVQPLLPFSSSSYNDVDYGRFIIDNVTYTTCGSEITSTTIEVYNSIYAIGTPVAYSSTGINVALYFSDNSVGFDGLNLIDGVSTGATYKRYFEMFVDSNGHTFSSERARFNITTGDTNLIKFNLLAVSPKLRGYPNNYDNLTNSSTSILFNLTSWNSTTGIYDGYLCNTITSNIGPVISGKKGEVTRFYDDTEIDFIDLKLEFANYDSLTTPVLFNPTPPVQLTIDLFPSLQLDEQVFYLGSAQLNTGTQQLYYVNDGRQFGGITENELSTSALAYIDASTKYLHQNGVIRGFDFSSITDNQVSFNGGMAVVNGTIVPYNDFTVSIPYVQESYNGTTYNGILWALCMNDKSEIQLIPLTDDYSAHIPSPPSAVSRQIQLLNPATSTTYYVDSLNFSYILTNRKDLTILWLITSIVTSATAITLNTLDARKYVTDSDSNIEAVLTSALTQGSFHSPTSLINWLFFNNQFNGIARIRGSSTFTSDPSLVFTYPTTLTADGQAAFTCVNLTTSNVTINGLTIIMNGTGSFTNSAFNNCTITLNSAATVSGSTFTNCTFNIVNLATGINLASTSSGTSFVGCTFNYTSNTSSGWVSTNFVNSSNGAIYCSPTLVQNVSITNCVFTSTTAARWPFISFEYNSSSAIMQGIRIRDNKFYNTSASDDMYAAIAFTSTLTTAQPTTGIKLIDCVVENNVCDKDQMIAFTATLNSSTAIVCALALVGVRVIGNVCGTIGVVGVLDNDWNYETYTTGIANDKLSGALIAQNTCRFIGSLSSTGISLPGIWYSSDYNPVSVVTAPVIVTENNCSWIHMTSCDGYYSGSIPSSPTSSAAYATNCVAQVTNNTLRAYNTSFIAALGEPVTGGSGGSLNAGIAVLPGADYMGSMIATGNNIAQGSYLTSTNTTVTYDYVNSVLAGVPGIISNNIFNNIQASTVSVPTDMLFAYRFAGFYYFTITDNQFYRNSNSINSYINLPSSTTGVITSNFFDYPTIDGSNKSLVEQLSTSIIISNNFNYTYSSSLSRNVSQPLIVNPYNGAPISFNLNGTFNDSVSSSYSYLLPCTKVLNGATITNVYVYYQTGSTAPTTSTPSNVGLYKLNNQTNTSSQIGSTVFVPTSGLSSNTQYYLGITGLSEVVADNGTTYYIKISTVSGSGAQSLTWYPVQIYFTNISSSILTFT